MQMSMSTNYAVRIIVELAKQKKKTTSELSILVGIPETYILKILFRLKKADLILSQQGSEGGFVLNKDTKIITLFDIVEVMEPNVKINRCLEDDKYCSRCAVETCNMRLLYCNIQREMEQELKKQTFYELLKTEGERS